MSEYEDYSNKKVIKEYLDLVDTLLSSDRKQEMREVYKNLYESDGGDNEKEKERFRNIVRDVCDNTDHRIGLLNEFIKRRENGEISNQEIWQARSNIT